MKILFARTAVFAAMAAAVLLGGTPANAATAPSASSYSHGDEDGIVDWWEQFWFGDRDDDGGGLFNRS
ncbi:hypothetical protein [Spirillospora sp. NPDC029432]|uniref:hypothetical protein n=1 Tax=Spirillospora sp. NPDC029432 TaxID=3154599 RepID=UPI0034526E17